MKTLAIIPARGGSKQIPGKNIRPLGGRPLIQWTIAQARDSGSFDRVVVSTDSKEIAGACAAVGQEVPWLRPGEFSRDDSPREEAVFHCLDRLSRDEGFVPDAVMLLQPTSPLRRPETIREALRIFRESGGDSVVSVRSAADHPAWCRVVDADGTLQAFTPAGPAAVRRQDLPQAFVLSGAIFLASLRTLKETGGFYGKRTRALITPREEAVDIDDEIDWILAEALIARGGPTPGRLPI